MGALNVFTYTITGGSLTIAAVDNVVRVSVICSSGTISVQGAAKFQGINPIPISLSVGQGITLTSPNVSVPLDSFTINAPTGGDAADVVISYQ
jgi:hypothetical protein